MPAYTITHIATTGAYAWHRVQTFGNRHLHSTRHAAELELEDTLSELGQIHFGADASVTPVELRRLDAFETMTLRVDEVPGHGGSVCPDGTVLAGVKIAWEVGPGRMLIADGCNVATIVRSHAGPGPAGADLLVRLVAHALQNR